MICRISYVGNAKSDYFDKYTEASFPNITSSYKTQKFRHQLTTPNDTYASRILDHLHTEDLSFLEHLISLDRRCEQFEEENQRLKQQLSSREQHSNLIETLNQELKAQLVDLQKKCKSGAHTTCQKSSSS
jgi:hypothetical protein